MCSRFRSAVLILFALSAGGACAAERELRICAERLANETAAVRQPCIRDTRAKILRDHPPRCGFRNRCRSRASTEDCRDLNANLCDVIMGVPHAFELVRTTAPYYRSTYEFVYRADNAPFESFDDSRLRNVRIGVQLVGNDLATTPPGHALAARGIFDNVIGYVPYGETPQPERMTDALANGELDVALMWGPQAAYYARRARVALTLSPAHAPAELRELPFEYDISMGVRKNDAALSKELDAAIARRRSDLEAILSNYGVPRTATSVARAEAERR